MLEADPECCSTGRVAPSHSPEHSAIREQRLDRGSGQCIRHSGHHRRLGWRRWRWHLDDNAGSTLNPTNIDIRGGTFNCNNSTMNVAGNIALGPSGNNIIPGAFNAGSGTVNIAGNFTTNNTAGTSSTGGTSTFNFNGSGAQSISGSLAPTFNNLIVNKTGGSTLTLGVNTPITGNLSVSQGNFNLVNFLATGQRQVER